MEEVQTFSGPAAPGDLGTTLIHEHVFVGHPELDLNLPHPEWCEDVAIETAVAGLERLWDLGVRTVVDLTVLGLGRDVARVLRVADRVRVRLVASTGYYTATSSRRTSTPTARAAWSAAPTRWSSSSSGTSRSGIADTGVRAGMLKVVTDQQGITPDVRRVMEAAATAHRRTGVPITTHTHAPSRNGRDQLAFFVERGVAPERLVIGHCGDSEDLDYLRELMDAGATIGMDRFGMEHVLPDDRPDRDRAGPPARGVRRPDGALPRRGVLQPRHATVVACGARAALAHGEHLAADPARAARRRGHRGPAAPDDGPQPGPHPRALGVRRDDDADVDRHRLPQRHADREAARRRGRRLRRRRGLRARPGGLARPARRRSPPSPAGSASRSTSTSRSATPKA